MMVCLHLFNRDYQGLFQPLIFIGKQPLSYYISLFSDACVPIFAFVSGYGLYYKYVHNTISYKKDNTKRLKKLYINYWIVLLLFAVVLGFILGKEGYPGSIGKLLFNITGLDPSYNGAWWFFTTYVFFVLTSKFWFGLLEQINPYLFMIALFLVYLTAFYFRIHKATLFDHPVLQWVHTQGVLYFCTLFQFMLGAFALKHNWHHRVSIVFNHLKQRSFAAIIVILLTIVFHGFVPNFVIAPFTALVFIFMFLQIKLPAFLNKSLDYFTPHSTNLWLIHMFFYMIYFSEFIYGFHYVPLIFIVLIAMCLFSSYIVNFINQKITARL